MLYIGIDLGTSAVKLLLMESGGKIVKIVSKEYSLSFPHPGWSEQNPVDWYEQSIAGLKELLDGQDKSQVAGISFGGQMHGLVILDEKDQVIRPAILWNDGRTTKETDYLNEKIGKDVLEKYTANIAYAGFTAPKILWVKENEPDNFAKIRKIMLPKDYLAYRLSGTFSTDYSDASGMLLLDVENKCWSKEMCDLCGVTEEMLPKLFESYEKIGTLKKEIADELGLSDSVVIAAGGGFRGWYRNGWRGKVQYFSGNFRNPVHLIGSLCADEGSYGASQLRAFGRSFPSDGLHAVGRKLQQVVERGDSSYKGLCCRAGGYHG